MPTHDGSGRGDTLLPKTYEDLNTVHLPGDMHLTLWGEGFVTLRRGQAQVPMTGPQAEAFLDVLRG